LEELMRVGSRATDDDSITRLDLSLASVEHMRSYIHHNATAKNAWEIKRIKRRQKGLYGEEGGIYVEWNTDQGFSCVVGNQVKTGLDGDVTPFDTAPPPELDATAFIWEGFGLRRSYVMYADFETTKKPGKKFQVPYCMGLIEEFTGREKLYWGEDCAVKFLEDLEEWFSKGDEVIVYYHNLGFDEKYLFQEGLKVNRILTTSAARTIVVYCSLANGARLTFKDSLRLLEAPEASFPKMFGLEHMSKWPDFPHHAVLMEDDGSLRWKTPEELGPAHAGEFDEQGTYLCHGLNGQGPMSLREAGEAYCMDDVRLLRAAMIVFKSWTAKVGIAADSVLTLPSLACTFAWLQGAYDGVCKYSGTLRAYLSSAIYGGRVMTRDNKPIIVEGDIANVDAVSLYPSAMKELPGMPTGPGYPIARAEEMAQYSFYVVTIRINTIGKRSPFPWICVRGADGLCLWTDDIEVVRDKDVVVDSIMLALIVKKHDITYDVICGWGWDNFIGNWPCVWVRDPDGKLTKEPEPGWTMRHEEIWRTFGWDGTNHYTIQDFLYGRRQVTAADRINSSEGNDGFSVVAGYMFEERKILKSAGNPAQLMYKLILNCFFGKTIEKPRCTQLAICEASKDWQARLRRESGRVRAFYFTGGIRYGNNVHSHVVIEVKVHSMGHKAWPHIGSAILSKSKVLMERLFEKVEDHVYYTDTDSCHMSMAEWLKFESQYIGTDLGKFHNDYAHPYTKAVKGIYLAKKVYFEGLSSEDGSREGELCKMKGVPQEAIDHVKKEMELTGEQLYERMISHVVEFPLALPTMPRFYFSKVDRTCQVRLEDEEVRKVGGHFGEPSPKRIRLE
jgi:hypothetical protein